MSDSLASVWMDNLGLHEPGSRNLQLLFEVFPDQTGIKHQKLEDRTKIRRNDRLKESHTSPRNPNHPVLAQLPI